MGSEKRKVPLRASLSAGHDAPCNDWLSVLDHLFLRVSTLSIFIIPTPSRHSSSPSVFDRVNLHNPLPTEHLMTVWQKDCTDMSGSTVSHRGCCRMWFVSVLHVCVWLNDYFFVLHFWVIFRIILFCLLVFTPPALSKYWRHLSLLLHRVHLCWQTWLTL